MVAGLVSQIDEAVTAGRFDTGAQAGVVVFEITVVALLTLVDSTVAAQRKHVLVVAAAAAGAEPPCHRRGER